MDCSCCCISSMPGGAMISTPIGMRAHLDLDLALVELAARAACSRNFCACLGIARLRRLVGGETHHARLRQQRIEHALLRGLRARARAPSAISCSRVILTATSASSLMMESTSRPT